MTAPLTARAYRVVCGVGARPHCIKIASFLAALDRRGAIRPSLPHIGQHDDAAMNEQYSPSQELPPPDMNVKVGSARDAVQAIMAAHEQMLRDGAASERTADTLLGLLRASCQAD